MSQMPITSFYSKVTACPQSTAPESCSNDDGIASSYSRVTASDTDKDEDVGHSVSVSQYHPPYMDIGKHGLKDLLLQVRK